MLHISYIIDIYHKGYPSQCEVAFVVLVRILGYIDARNFASSDM